MSVLRLVCWGAVIMAALYGAASAEPPSSGSAPRPAVPAGKSPVGAAPGPEMVLVPAGPFVRGDKAGEADERPQRRLELPAFAIDRTEVTRGAYGECVVQGKCRPALAADQAADSVDRLPRTLPVANVSWHDAAAYCAFVGKRLPTEAEWEKAARGPDGRRYPWGDEFACARGNFGNFAGDGRCAEDGAPGGLMPVGSFPGGASPYGALDMAGNVWEWVADPYAADAYLRPPLRPAPVTLDGGHAKVAAKPQERRVLHGGGCCSIFGLPRSADRLALPPTYKDADIGFRCAQNLQDPQAPQAPQAPPARPGPAQPTAHPPGPGL